MTSPARPSPRPCPVAGPLVGAAFLAGVAGGIAVADAPFPRPGADAGALRAYYRGSPAAARTSAAGQLVSALALTRLAGAVARAARRTRARPRTLQVAALAGGALASASLATSAVTAARLTLTDDDQALRRRARRAFAVGGPIHGVGFGLLTAALALTAHDRDALPRPAVAAGLVAAAAGIASPLYWVHPDAAWLIPAGRFPGLVLAGVYGTRRTA
jgi:hypothetical protein